MNHRSIRFVSNHVILKHCTFYSQLFGECTWNLENSANSSVESELYKFNMKLAGLFINISSSQLIEE